MQILYLYQYHHSPDCAAGGRHYTFLEHLARQHEVTLLTSTAWRGRRLTTRYPWVPPGVRHVAFDVPYENRLSIPERLWAYARYAAAAALTALTMPRPDVILASSTPLTTAMAGALLARYFGVPWVFEVRDLWPAFPIQMGALRAPALRRSLEAIERLLYRSARRVLPLSPDMAKHVVTHGGSLERVHLLSQGADIHLADATSVEAVAALRRRHDLDGKYVVLYAGTLGRANAIPAVLNAAHRLRDRRDIVFLFAGEGYHAPQVQRASRSLRTVHLVPPQPHHRMFAWFRLATLSLVPFLPLPVLGTCAPAKLFDSLAAGTPVLVTTSGWMQRFVHTHDCGWYAPPRGVPLASRIRAIADDPAAAAAAGERGTAIVRAEHDRRALADRLASVLAAAVAEDPGAGTGVG